MKNKSLITIGNIRDKIYLIRGEKVMLDQDLALLYKVEVRRLKEQVRRNIRRFPSDFMFKLRKKEKEEVIANCDHLKKLRFSPSVPYAFTEQGVAMLSSVLRSQRAIDVNIEIMRTFTKLRSWLSTHEQLKKKLERMEKKYDKRFQIVFDFINRLAYEEKHPKPVAGFRTE